MGGVLSGIVIVSSSAVLDTALQEPAARTLAALVPAAVAGLLGDVWLAAPAAVPGLEPLASHAGCRLLQRDDAAAALMAAIAAARYDDILLLAAGCVPAGGFHNELDSLMRAGSPRCLMRLEAAGVLQRFVPSLCPPVLLTAPRRDMLAAAPAFAAGGGLPAMARRLVPLRLLAMRATRADGGRPTGYRSD